MIKKLLRAFLLLGIAGICCGCSGKNKPVSSLTEGGEPGKAEGTVKPQRDEKKIEIELPKGSRDIADYSTTDGLKVPAGMYIAVVAKNRASDYWKAVEQGAQQAVDELNEQMGYKKADKVKMTFEGPATEEDVETQINTIDAVLAENPSVLCLGVIDQDSCQAQLEAARDNGIPVVIVDSGLKGEIGLKSCATDNYEAGREAARRLCGAIGNKGEVAVSSHAKNTQSSMERIRGFREELAQNHPEVKLVRVNYESDEKTLEEMLLKTMEEYPELAGIFSTNDEVTKATLDVLEDMEECPKVVGMDASKQIREAIAEERLVGSICQNPYAMGYATVVLAVREALGLTNQKFVNSGFRWIDRQNLDAKENQKFFY